MVAFLSWQTSAIGLITWRGQTRMRQKVQFVEPGDSLQRCLNRRNGL
jgi:hypothetical protein